MAVVLPVVAAFQAVAAAGGVAAALTAGFASFATVAGGFLVGAGIVTGNKGLKKLGGIMSLAGGVTSLVDGMVNGASAASSAADGASSAWDAAGSAAGSDAAQFGKYANDASKAVDGAAQAGEALSGAGGLAEAGSAMSVSQGAALAPPAMQDLSAIGPAADGGSSLMEQARLAKATPLSISDTIAAQNTALARAGGGPSQALVEAAGQLNGQDHMQQLLGKLKTGASGVSQVIKDNKELMQLGGMALQSIYDPQREAMDRQDSLYERRRAQLNNPIRLTTQRG